MATSTPLGDRRSEREPAHPTWMIREKCDELKEALNQLLSIDTTEIKETSELYNIAKEVKTQFRVYSPLVLQLIRKLSDNGEVEQSQQYFSSRKSIAEETEAFINIINAIIRKNGADSISNVGTDNHSLSTVRRVASSETIHEELEESEDSNDESYSETTCNITLSGSKASTSNHTVSVQSKLQPTCSASTIPHENIPLSSHVVPKYIPLSQPSVPTLLSFNVSAPTSVHHTQPPMSAHHMQPPVSVHHTQPPVSMLPQQMNVPSYATVPPQHQNKISDPLSLHLLKQELFRASAEPFDGDPAKFNGWMSLLQNKIKNIQLDPIDVISIYSANTKGPPHNLVNGYLSAGASNPLQTLHNIESALLKQFGSPIQICSALRCKLKEFPNIKPPNLGTKIREFSLLCCSIEANMHSNSELSIFNLATGQELIWSKLPDWLARSWFNYSHQYSLRNNISCPPFTVLVNFIKDKAEEMLNPNFLRSSFFVEKENRPKNVNTFKTEEASSTSEETPTCLYHKRSGHALLDCKAFRKLTHSDKQNFVRENKLCFRCLDKHLKSQCTSDARCTTCKGDHSTLLHYNKPRQQSSIANVNATATETSNEESSQRSGDIQLCSAVCGNVNVTKSCSKVVLVNISHHSSPRKVRCYVIIDEQSNSSFLDPKLADLLGVTGPSTELYITTMTGYRCKTSGNVIEGLTVQGVEEPVSYDLPPMTTIDSIPDCKLEVASPRCVEMFPHISQFAKFFQEIDPDAEVLALIGRDGNKILKTECFGDEAPFVHHTTLGWALVGTVCPLARDRTVLKINHEHFISEPCFPNLPKVVAARNVFVENPDDNEKGLSKNDQKFVDIVQQGTYINDQGNITMPLPFKNKDILLPDNRVAVYYRTKNTLTRLKCDEKKLNKCVEIMGNYIELQHVEKVPLSDIKPKVEGKEWFLVLPVFPVCNKKKEKIRLVFDSSAQYDGVSLNDQLLQGPDGTNRLRGVLFRFRLGEVGFSGDIESMFYCFHLDPPDKSYVKFFWFDHNDPTKELVQYRGCVHLFGNRPSPAIANFGLLYAAKNSTQSTPETLSFIETNFYVDDALGSTRTVENAFKILSGVKDALHHYNIRLHKLASNSKELMNFFPYSERVKQATTDLSRSSTQTALGLAWDLETDELYLKADLPEKHFTKRGIIAVINSIFDPLGFAGPVILGGKIIQRKIFTSNSESSQDKVDWDDPLSNQWLNDWSRWKDSLTSVDTIRVKRSFIPPDFGAISSTELHVFADASQDAIGAVVYIRYINDSNICHCSLVTSKTKLIPRSATTIPRAELCAAVEAAELAHEVMDELRLHFSTVKFYSDSMVTLGYLNNCDKSFTKYVTNRVFSILKLSNPSQWFFVATECNPADIATRTHTVKELKKTSWLNGPDFLQTPRCEEEDHPAILPANELPEIKDVCILSTVNEPLSPQQLTIKASKTWLKAVSTAQVILSFIRKLEEGKKRCNVSIAINNPNVPRSEAENWLVTGIQYQEFKHLFHVLQSHKTLNDSQLSSLNPFLDQDNVIRVGGRLRNSSLPFHEKHPILLPKSHKMSLLIVQHYHLECKHQGRHITMATIRQAGFFILKGTGMIKNFLKNCVMCIKLRGQASTQLMADLPASRLSHSPPFTHTGLDVFGHFNISSGKTTRRSPGSFKIWCLLLTCMSSRAVHVEPLFGLDITSLKNALSRFSAIRGTPKHLYSDRGTNFVGVDKQLNLEVLQDGLKDYNLEWHFNVPHASHHGGPWERKIGAIRRVLEASLLHLRERLPTLDEFTAYLAECSSIVNNTPLSFTTADTADPLPVCPAKLITLQDDPNPPPLDHFTSKDILSYGKQRWRRVQFLADCFWSQWKQQYLRDLQERNKWTKPQRKISVGDVILMREKNVKRNVWPMALVIDVKTGADNLVRSATVRTSTGNVYTRPITEMILLAPASSN